MAFSDLNVDEMYVINNLRDVLELEIDLPFEGERWSKWTASDKFKLARKLGIDVKNSHVRQCVAFVELD